MTDCTPCPDPRLPVPSPVPSPSNTPYPLSERINIATRSIHSQLNKMIIERLPLALPPHTTNPSVYISGILHIVPIYHTFESLWQALLDSPHLSTSLRDDASLNISETASSILEDSHFSAGTISSRLFSLLSHLCLPGLLRTGRLRADIRSLTGVPEHLIDDQIAAVSSNGELARFIENTTKSVEMKPHVLVAHAWVLYMALFSGGRYIRASLQHAGGLSKDFWARNPSPVRPLAITAPLLSSSSPLPADTSHATRPSLPNIPIRNSSRSQSRTGSGADSNSVFTGTHYLQFLGFAGEDDGEDLKREFKKRLAEAEMLLKEGEKEDIIHEAVKIFEGMVVLVRELDCVCGRAVRDGREQKKDDIQGSEDEPSIAAANGSLQPPQRHEIRDSVAVARPGWGRKNLEIKMTHQADLLGIQEYQVFHERERGRLRSRSNLNRNFTARIGKLVRFNSDNLRGEGRKSADTGNESSMTRKLILILSGVGLWALLGMLVLLHRFLY